MEVNHRQEQKSLGKVSRSEAACPDKDIYMLVILPR